jgi:hypothetical protein
MRQETFGGMDIVRTVLECSALFLDVDGHNLLMKRSNCGTLTSKVKKNRWGSYGREIS